MARSNTFVSRSLILPYRSLWFLRRETDTDAYMADKNQRPRLEYSDTLLQRLLQQRETLIRDKIKYEESYFISDEDERIFNEHEESLFKQYILSADVNKSMTTNSRKMGSAYVGCSRKSALNRLQAHNGESGQTVRKGTLRGRSQASKWQICLVLFLPKMLTQTITSKIMRDYLKAAHKVEGKVRRGLQVARLFGLRHWSPPNSRLLVANIQSEVKTAPAITHDSYEFRGSNSNSNGIVIHNNDDTDDDNNSNIN
jgi:hypothetical protein